MEYLHEDLTTVESITPFLKQCVGKGKEVPPGNVLQVQQIVNVSFPTYEKPTYNSDKHTLKLTVTDGQSQGYALVTDSCPGIDLNTPPGTKIKVTQPIPVQGSLLILTRNNCEVLGGRVARLYEKWDAQKKHAIKHEWGFTGTSMEDEGPPPWKPFGYKPSLDVAALRKMKTTDVANDKKDGKSGEKSQFDMQRDEAVSELLASANKQKFQKPNKHLVDKEIADIMEEGFSKTDAEYAMNKFKNTQKAIKFLKEANARHEMYTSGPPPPKPFSEDRRERKDRRRKGKGKNDEDDEQEVPAEYQRPTKSISLFGFIEGQIAKSEEHHRLTHPTLPEPKDPTKEFREKFDRHMQMRNAKSDSYVSKGNDRGRGGYSRGGGRGGGVGGGGGERFNPFQNSHRYDSGNKHFENNSPRYDSGSQRYDPLNRYDKSKPLDINSEIQTERPPRFQRGAPENRSTDYHSAGSRNQSSFGGSGFDSYRHSDRGQNRDGYDSRSYHHDTSTSRQEYSGNYHQQRSAPNAKDRTYSSDYNARQQYSKSNDYPVPSQNYTQQHSYQQQQQQQQHQPSQQRSQYGNMGGQNHNSMSHRGGGDAGPQRSTQSHYSNHSGGGGHLSNQQNPPGEFQHYQYGYEGYNPNQTMVFTRSKPEGRGRGGYQGQGNGRGAPAQNNSYGRPNPNNRY